jgi:hypothetical protein
MKNHLLFSIIIVYHKLNEISKEYRFTKKVNTEKVKINKYLHICFYMKNKIENYFKSLKLSEKSISLGLTFGLMF